MRLHDLNREMTGESNELQKKFQHRQDIIENPENTKEIKVGGSIYSKFPEFSRKQLKEYESFFKKYDSSKTGKLKQTDLQKMFEKMGNALTFLELKEMIVEADTDGDQAVDLDEFLTMISKISKGDLASDSPWIHLAKLSEISIETEGVGGAKNFFEAKVKAIEHSNRNEKEIMEEREERKKIEEEKKQKRAEFKNLRANFQ